MSIDFFGGSETKTYVDLLVQIGVLIGFGAGFVGFLYKTITGKLGKAIDERIEPIKQSQDALVAKMNDIQEDMCKTAASKEEIDRERFRNVSTSQDFIKESIKDTIETTDDTKKKLDHHLLESASFVGKTNERMSYLEKVMDGFRSFMHRVESR